jgi:adenosylhomocysteine nucleosidase
MPEVCPRVVVLISADAEWEAVTQLFPDAERMESTFGGWFFQNERRDVLFFQGGWGKISAAASTQYVIDRWKPELLVNLGTCGGFEGEVERGSILLIDRTIVYDLLEQMAIDLPILEFYSTSLDLSWLGEQYPILVKRTLIVSGDRDLVAGEIPALKEKFGAVAGDWESGAIAWVAARNQTRLLILRGVTDLVGSSGGEAYGDYDKFKKAARAIMERLITSLPDWIALVNWRTTT